MERSFVAGEGGKLCDFESAFASDFDKGLRQDGSKSLVAIDFYDENAKFSDVGSFAREWR